MAAGARFVCPKFTFDRTSGHFRSIYMLLFLQNYCRRPFWMSEINFRSHFWPFQINTKLFFDLFFTNFGCPKFTFDRISGHFRSIMQLCCYKMAAGGHFGWDDNVNYRTRPRYLDE